MTKGLLSWLGLFAILALAGGGAAAWALVKDRTRIVVMPDQAADPVAQQVAALRDDLAQLHGDVRALAEAMGSNLQRLADAQGEDAAGQRDRLAGLARQVQQTDQHLRARLDSLQAAQGELRTALSEVAANATPPQPQDDVAVATDDPVPQPPAAERPTADEPPPAGPVAAATPARRSFLAFTLPSQSFRFDRAQSYELIPTLSRVGFDAKSTLHDFTGVTSRLRGHIDVDLSDPAAGCHGEIRVEVRGLDTGLEGRNDNMLEHLAAAEHPEIVFAVESMTTDSTDPDAMRSAGTVRGKMTIRGVTRSLTMPVKLSVDDSRRVHADGEAALRLTDYGVPVPSQLGLISMQDEVRVWIALQARSTGAAPEVAGAR